ncbi:ATP-binding protein [Streptomyces sp. NPDC006356]
MRGKRWELSFTAEPEEVPSLRRVVGLHLGSWGLLEVVEAAQLCVSELVSNVITHVGYGTPATLAVSMSGTHLRVEVHDPDTRALPTLIEANADAEAGRGMALVGAIADSWGVQLLADRKVTWCELATGLSASGSRHQSPCIALAERVFHLYDVEVPARTAGTSRLGVAVTEAVAVEAIANVLHWLRVHGHDADEALDRAQTRFETELESAGESP